MTSAASGPEDMTGQTPADPATKTPFVDTRRFRVMRAIVGAGNPLVRSLLGSRFGGKMNEALLLLRFKGRTTGKWYATPVGYVRDGDVVVVVTSPSYAWWKNVRDGADVQVRAAGQWYAAHARVVAPDDPAFDRLVALQVARRGPGMLRGFGLPIDDEGRLPDAARADASSHALIVEIRLGETFPGPSDQ